MLDKINAFQIFNKFQGSNNQEILSFFSIRDSEAVQNCMKNTTVYLKFWKTMVGEKICVIFVCRVSYEPF